MVLKKIKKRAGVILELRGKDSLLRQGINGEEWFPSVIDRPVVPFKSL